jgi:hypothetical protein
VCKKKDPNLNECLQTAVQKAIREMKPGKYIGHCLPQWFRKVANYRIKKIAHFSSYLK